jgi:hypothetical protein
MTIADSALERASRRYGETMERVEALHVAARRYSAARAAEWENRYTELQAEEERARRREGVPEPTTYTYSPEALAAFPRYHVLHAIEAAVEAFTPADFGSLEEAREFLAAAGAGAESIFTRPPTGEVEQRAMDEERELFGRYVRGLSSDELANIEPLPFRRTLATEESTRLWAELERRWGVKGYWYPLDRAPDAERPLHTEAFNSDPFFDAQPQQYLRDALAELGVSRLWELRELDTDADKEIELEQLEPRYTGSEGYWTDDAFEWLVYASHEDSVTVAGERLLPALQRRWPDWAKHGYDARYE